MVSPVKRVVDALYEQQSSGINDGWINRRDLYRHAVVVPAHVLDGVVALLKARGELEERTVPVARNGRIWGRQPTEYRYTASAAPLPLELPPEFRFEAPAAKAPEWQRLDGPRRCTWCFKELPVQLTGRPRLFCDIECRNASTAAAGNQLLQILRRPQDVYTLNETAWLVAMADLRSRGFRIYTTPAAAAPFCINNFVDPPKWVSVYVADTEGGHPPAAEGIDVLAIVRRDGGIRYEGLDVDVEEGPGQTDGGVGDEADPARGSGECAD